MSTLNKVLSEIDEAAIYIKGKIEAVPEIALILGSGLGELAEEVDNSIIIPYQDIPHFPVSTVKGHDGALVIGSIEGKNVLMMKGRVHYYEGYSFEEVTFPIRVMKKLGIKKLLVTNAAGAVNKGFAPSDLMIISDHINVLGLNPLIGPNIDEMGPRFPDMTYAYSKDMIDIINSVSYTQKIDIKEGVYAYLPGPNYETRAEVNMLRTLGADAVGMSTVPEVVVARHSNIETAGISCITNMASGILDTPLSHEEVMITTNKVKEKFKALVKEVVKKL